MSPFRKNKKYQQILTAGKELFWKYGFKRVSIEEICKEAGVSKMTYYKYFENKVELAKTILDEVFEDSLVKLNEICISDWPAEKKLQQMILMKSEGVKNISAEFMQDFYANPKFGLQSYLEQKSREVSEEVIRVFKKGQETGWVRKDVNIEFAFQFILNSISLMQSDQEQYNFEKTEDMILEITRLFIFGLAPHDIK